MTPPGPAQLITEDLFDKSLLQAPNVCTPSSLPHNHLKSWSSPTHTSASELLLLLLIHFTILARFISLVFFCIHLVLSTLPYPLQRSGQSMPNPVNAKPPEPKSRWVSLPFSSAMTHVAGCRRLSPLWAHERTERYSSSACSLAGRQTTCRHFRYCLEGVPPECSLKAVTLNRLII